MITPVTVNLTDKFETMEGKEVTIYSTNHPGKYPVIGRIENGESVFTWTLSGIYYLGCTPTSGNKNLRKVSPYKNFKEGDEVVVWDYPDCKHKRIFSHVDSDGIPRAFNDGYSAWTSPSQMTCSWKNCIKREDYAVAIHGSIQGENNERKYDRKI